MKRLLRVSWGILVGLCATASPGAEPLTLVQTIPLEGVEGRFDHMAFDADTGKLYVAALGNNTVEVIDVKNGKRLETIPGPKEPQGIRLLPESKTLVVASGEDGTCRFWDPTLKLTGSLSDLEDADNVRYDAKAKRVYVGYGNGALAVIDPTGPRKTGEIKLSGHPESFQLESNGNRIFVNVPAAKQIAVIDRTSGTVVSRWPVDEAEDNFPMALDEVNRRIFIGCRKPAKLLVLDTESGKAVTSMACCGDTDDVFYDIARKRIYVSGGEGCVTVIEQADADTYNTIATVATAPGARTSLFDTASGRLFVAVPHRDAQDAAIRIFQAQP